MFDRLYELGVKLKAQKCDLLRKEVRYLGHAVSAEGICTDPEKISNVGSWKRPVNHREMLQSQNFSGYYWRFIEAYASIAALLYWLISEDPSKRHRNRKCPVAKELPFRWNDEAENSCSAWLC